MSNKNKPKKPETKINYKFLTNSGHDNSIGRDRHLKLPFRPPLKMLSGME